MNKDLGTLIFGFYFLVIVICGSCVLMVYIARSCYRNNPWKTIVVSDSDIDEDSGYEDNDYSIIIPS